MKLIKNGKILTMANESYENGCVLIEGSKIAKIAEHIEETPDMEVIDAKGGWVMPGIIEAHCHVGITEEKKGIEGDDCNEMTNPITPFVRAIDGINTLDAAFDDAVRAGITSIMVGPGSANVVGGQFVFMKTKGRVIDELKLYTAPFFPRQDRPLAAAELPANSPYSHQELIYIDLSFSQLYSLQR